METAPVSTSSRTLKVRSSKSADSSTSKPVKVVTVKRKAKSIVKPKEISGDLNQMIATAAYFIAKQRNFAPGNELSDWLLAEQQILAVHNAN